jgi:hypothetical protein
LTVTIGFLPRGDAAWIASATTSLPTPLSPSISRGTRARAAFAAIAKADRNSGAEPTISSNASSAGIFSVKGLSSPAAVPATAASNAASRRSGASGFTRKSVAPARIAATACATDPSAVNIRMGSAGRRSRSAAMTAQVSEPGALWSSRIASSCIPSCAPSVATPISPSEAKIERHPARAASADTSRRWAGSSSIRSSRR